MRLAVITATTNSERARTCIESWHAAALHDLHVIIVTNGEKEDSLRAAWTVPNTTWLDHPEYLGTVPAFKLGIDYALKHLDAEILANLHDDFRIDESRWDEKVLKHFDRHPLCGLAGFGAAIGLGDIDIYQKPYDPMQLARIGFRSNLVEAEAHGLRSLLPEKVACLDGFSQVGRRDFWNGYRRNGNGGLVRYSQGDRPWDVLQTLGVTHHLYDGLLGCLAKRYNWETWYIPLRGHHFGGRTAVGDKGYGNWAKTQVDEGDQGFWKAAHQIGYEAFRDVLPIRV